MNWSACQPPKSKPLPKSQHKSELPSYWASLKCNTGLTLQNNKPNRSAETQVSLMRQTVDASWLDYLQSNWLYSICKPASQSSDTYVCIHEERKHTHDVKLNKGWRHSLRLRADIFHDCSVDKKSGNWKKYAQIHKMFNLLWYKPEKNLDISVLERL